MVDTTNYALARRTVMLHITGSVRFSSQLRVQQGENDADRLPGRHNNNTTSRFAASFRLSLRSARSLWLGPIRREVRARDRGNRR